MKMYIEKHTAPPTREQRRLCQKLIGYATGIALIILVAGIGMWFGRVMAG